MARGAHWRSKEDLILVETLTEFVAKGISIHEAFPTVAERLNEAGYNRTDKACYSRWNNHLDHIYGKAIELAVRKQQENAQRVVESILDNQSPLQVIPSEAPKVELLMPTFRPNMTLNPNLNSPTMPTKIEGVGDVVSFLNNINFQMDEMRRENNQYLEELEKAWDENEKLKLQLVEYLEMKEKFDKFRELASKIESVNV